MSKSLIQTCVEKSTCGSEFLGYNHDIDKALLEQDKIHFFVVRLIISPEFSVTINEFLVACGISMIILKRSTTLSFHNTSKYIASCAIEFQNIYGKKNWSDFLTKAVDNSKFMNCTKSLIFP